MTEFSESQKKYMDNLFKKISEQFINQTNQIVSRKIEEVKSEINGIAEKYESKISALEEKNKELQNNVTKLERKIRKNNLVIFGLEEGENNLWNTVINTFNSILEEPLNKTDISDIYKIGKNHKVIVVEFITFHIKSQILKNAKKLKGRDIFIANDLSWEDRQNHKLLSKHMKEAREKGKQANIRGNTLIIANKIYTVEELKQNSTDVNLVEDRIEGEEVVSDVQIQQEHLETEKENQKSQEKIGKKVKSTITQSEVKVAESASKPQTRSNIRKIDLLQ